jgi:hypothetical protein
VWRFGECGHLDDDGEFSMFEEHLLEVQNMPGEREFIRSWLASMI